jgi:hypothetical protein
MILSGEQRAYVAIKHEVGLHGPLDCLGDIRVGGMN